jgi:hypothetical protein
VLMTRYSPEQSRQRNVRPEMYPGWTVARDRSFTINGASLAAVSVPSKVRRIIMVTAMMFSLVEIMDAGFGIAALTYLIFFSKITSLYFQVQYLNALAESLIGFRERTRALRLGIAIVMFKRP